MRLQLDQVDVRTLLLTQVLIVFFFLCRFQTHEPQVRLLVVCEMRTSRPRGKDTCLKL